MYLYFFIAFWGSGVYLAEGFIKEYSNSWYSHLEIILQSLFFGLLFASINSILDRTYLRKKSFGHIIFIKSFLYGISLIIAGFFVYSVFYIFDILPYFKHSQVHSLLSFRFILSIVVYLIFSILLISFILQVNRKFGPGILIKMIRGKYHRPREENLIIMFLDLKSSTTIAENLGHNKYSQFIRNCIQDLNDTVVKYHAQIYQYVGDEVVLYWKVKQGLNNLNCLKMRDN